MNPERVYLPPLPTKRGLIKNFYKTMNQNSAGFMYLTCKCLRISDARIKELCGLDWAGPG